MSSGDAIELYFQYRVAVYRNLSTGIACGAYVIVYATSVYVLLSKPGFTSSLPRIFMFGITTFMFTLGIIALVLVTATGLQTMHSTLSINGDLPHSFKIYYDTWAVVTCLMYILCDTICAWRTVVLWNYDKRIIGALGFFLLRTTVGAGFSVFFGLVQDDLSLGELDVILIGPTLITNLLSTGLIAWKAWQCRFPVRGYLCEGKGSLRVGRVFALLIESGLIYCCIWILYWISTSNKLPDPGFTFIVFISGLYPTLIIILVSKQLSPVDHYSTHLTEIQYTHVPGLEPPADDGGVSQHGVHHDSTSDSEIPSTVYMNPARAPSDEETCFLK